MEAIEHYSYEAINSKEQQTTQMPEGHTPNIESQCSFVEGIQQLHAENIWKSSIVYIQRIRSQVQSRIKKEVRNLNDLNIYSRMELQTHQPLQQAVYNNKYLREQQKKQLIFDIDKENELNELLIELNKIYNTNIFEEMLYIIWKIWDDTYIKWKSSRQNIVHILRLFSFQYLDSNSQTLLDLESKHKPLFYQYSYEQILQKANHGIEALSDILFSNLRFINLAGQSDKQAFTLFIKEMAATIFLCIEGYYGTPQQETEAQSESNNPQMDTAHAYYESQQDLLQLPRKRIKRDKS